jgi:hypothetical protein
VHDYAIDNCFIVEHQQTDLAHRHRGYLAFRIALKMLMIRTISGRVCSTLLTLAKNEGVNCPKPSELHLCSSLCDTILASCIESEMLGK